MMIAWESHSLSLDGTNIHVCLLYDKDFFKNKFQID